MKGKITEMADELADRTVEEYCPGGVHETEWDLPGLASACARIFFEKDMVSADSFSGCSAQEDLKARLRRMAHEVYAKREELFTGAGLNMRDIERVVLLRFVDNHWMDHIDAMDQLREGITLQAYGQKDPIVEYRIEGFNMFEEMVAGIQEDTIRVLFHIAPERKPIERKRVTSPMRTNLEAAGSTPAPKKAPSRSGGKVGRNAPCPCGSGKKYKNCCGKNA